MIQAIAKKPQKNKERAETPIISLFLLKYKIDEEFS